MKRQILIVILATLSTSLFAAEVEREAITSCAYQSGTAYEIQKIRQSQGDTWETFQSTVKHMYQDTPGRSDLLNIGKRVYFNPVSVSPEDIENQILESCLKRYQGKEPMT